jgi:hypothetical protein
VEPIVPYCAARDRLPSDGDVSSTRCCRDRHVRGAASGADGFWKKHRHHALRQRRPERPIAQWGSIASRWTRKAHDVELPAHGLGRRSVRCGFFALMAAADAKPCVASRVDQPRILVFAQALNDA